MGIVIITIPGVAQRVFADELHRRTGGKVDLVIIQKPKRHSFVQGLGRLYRNGGFSNLFKELWYAFLLRFDKKKTVALSYFRANDLTQENRSSGFKILEVDSVNSDMVFDSLKTISPKLLVVWGSTILDHRIVDTADRAINLHFGYCPYYRGALANQDAILNGELDKVGATIHYINGTADAGDILDLIKADPSKKPLEMFKILNTVAREKYVEIAQKLYEGRDLPSNKQDHIKSKVLFLRQWTPSMRYRVAEKILELERG